MAIAFQMFDVDDSGSIDLPEFRKVTDGLRSRMGKAAHLSHFKRTGFSSQCGPCCSCPVEFRPCPEPVGECKAGPLELEMQGMFLLS